MTQEILYRPPKFYFEDFHFEWQRWELDRNRTLFLAPRGSLKTTVLTVAKNVFKILRNFLLFDERDIMLGIGSEVRGKSVDMVTAIRRHFEDPTFIEIFGDLRGSTWREDELTFKGAKLKEKESNVTAFGMDSSAVSSKHFTDLDIDDCVSFENAQTFNSREKMWKRFGFDVLPCLEPDADSKSLHMRGTRYHPDDLWGREIKFPHTEIRREKALQDDGTSFWPRMFPVERLLKMQRDNPAMFAAQYQNDVEAMREMAIIRQLWAVLFKIAELQRHGLYYQIAIDPGGVSERDESSAMGISVIGAQSQQGAEFGHVHVLESENVHGDVWTLAKMVIDFWEKYQKCKIVVEDVALQRVYQDIFDKESKLRNYPHIDIVGIKSAELKDKVTLGRGVTHFWTRGQVHIDPAHTSELYGKLEDYPQPGTDDVNALLINLKYLKDHWSARMDTRKSEPQPQIRRSSATGY